MSPHTITNKGLKTKSQSDNRLFGVGVMKRGFTLVELIVAVFIFTVLITVAGGSFVSGLSLQRRALNLKEVEENGRFILELMARELRVANPITTPNTACPEFGSSFIEFNHPVNGNIRYDLVSSQIQRRVDGVDSIISNPDIEVTDLAFCIDGNSLADNEQPRVTVILRLKAGGLAREAAALDLQTTVSQRVLAD